MAERVFIVAEAGMNHDGSLGIAGRMVDVAVECGVDAVKFQLHDASAETTANAPPPPYFGAEPRYAYFQRTAFDDAGWRSLADRCRDGGVEFVCSPFSIEAVERLDALGVGRFKIGSGEVTNLPMLRRIAATGRPVILSSGMSSWEELDAAVSVLRDGGPLELMQCTSEYPCLPEHVGLNVIAEMRERYALPVGLSDHTLGLGASIAAVAHRAASIERHFTLSRSMYGPDAVMSLEPDELKQLVFEIRDVERMLRAPVDKTDVSRFADMKRIFEKSVVSVTDIPAGSVIETHMVAVKKPGTGIPARRLDEVIGLRARRTIEMDVVLVDEDVEWRTA
ncbi:MAG: N-acetylneuraminate synthase family protein [Solirubrobacteraceae bacterium]